MKVLYVCQEYPARTQTFVVNEAAAVASSGNDVFLYSLRGADEGLSSERVVHLNASVSKFERIVAMLLVPKALANRRVRTRFLSEGFSAARMIRQAYAVWHAVVLSRILRNLGTRDLAVHVHFLGRALDVSAYLADLGVPSRVWTATTHAADASVPPSAKRTLDIVRLVDGVFAASEAVGRALFLSTEVRPSGIVHCGIIPRGSQDTSIASGTFKIVTVGRLVRKKGVDVAIRAATVLKDRGLVFKWSIIGAGPLESELRAQASDAGVGEFFEWHGSLPHSKVLSTVAASQVFVLPSVRSPDGDIDGIPVALMEAMTLGVPVVSSYLSGIPELVKDGETGRTVDPGDHVGLAQAIMDLQDPSTRDILKGEAKRFVDEQFNQYREAEKLVSWWMNWS
ncbi:hypothetical protein SAT01_37510 [Sinomonas atrocyanea]|nr:hypothetical protein SAT01_37510 [Sinomonas atrocyanea]